MKPAASASNMQNYSISPFHQSILESSLMLWMQGGGILTVYCLDQRRNLNANFNGRAECADRQETTGIFTEMYTSNWIALVGHLEGRRKEAAKSKKHITQYYLSFI